MKSKLALTLALLASVATFVACEDEPADDTDVVIEEPLEATEEPVIEENMTDEELGEEEMMTGEDPTAGTDEELDTEDVPDPDSDY